MKNYKTKGTKIFNGITIIILTLFGLICFFPFYYLIIYAVSDPALAATGVTIYPKGLSLANFKAVFELEAIPRAALVSVVRTVSAASLTVICSSFFAYLMTKKDVYCRKFIYRFVIITMYVSGGIIPTYMVYRFYGLTNTFWVYILPGIISAYYVILIKTFIEQIPDELEEAATIDGAGVFTSYYKIILPLSKPILATVAVFSLVAEWNYWFDTLIYVTNERLYTFQYVLYDYLENAQRLTNQLANRPTAMSSAAAITPMSIRMTITLVVTLPILCVYPFMQRYFVEGIMLGAVKG